MEKWYTMEEEDFRFAEHLRFLRLLVFVAENKGLMKAAATETAKPIVKKSADKGKFRTTLPENTYRVIVEKIGFKKQEVFITVAANGETTNLNIELVTN